MKPIEDLTDNELKKEYNGLFRCINDSDSFSSSDVLRLAESETELLKRGYKILPSYEIIKNDSVS